MDNERPIEKLLRHYAKKRRGDAGEPLAMHPATRRLLQGEVARQFARPRAAGFSLAGFLARWRPGVVYALCALALVAVSVPLLIPVFRKAEPGFDLARAVPAETSADEKLSASRPLTAPVAEADTAQAATGVPASEVKGQATLTDQAKDKLMREPLEKENSQPTTVRSFRTVTSSAEESAAPPAPQLAIRNEPQPTAAVPAPIAPAPASREAKRAALPATAASAPAAPESAAFYERYGLARTAATTLVQKFSQTVATGASVRPADSRAAASPILQSFQLEQVGRQVRVIDSDGSTYTGALTLPGADLSYKTRTDVQEKSVRKTEEATVGRMEATPVEFQFQAGQNYSFRVAGTNRTLRQPVVFSGDLTILTNAQSAGQVGLAQLPVDRSQNQLVPPALSQLPFLLNSSISGKLQLGTNRELQINALPVPP